VWSRIEKQRKIIDFTLSSLARRKGRNLALSLVYAGVVFLLASVLFMTGALRMEAKMLLGNAPELVVQRQVAGRHDLMPNSYLDVVRSITGARNVKSRLWGYYFDPSLRANYTLVVPEKFSSGEGTVVIGQGISRIDSAFPGDILSIRGYDGRLVNLTVNSVLSLESALLTSDLMLISKKDFITIFNIPPDHFTDLTLSVENAGDLPGVAAGIVDRLPDTRIISRQDILKTYADMFDWRGNFILFTISATIWVIGILAMDKAFGFCAEERKEIGILKAIGWNASDVLLVKFWEGILISLCAFLNGILPAYVHVFYMQSVLFTPVLKGWSVLYPDFRLTPFVNPREIAILFFLTIVPYTLATIVPSLKLAAVDPDTGMRT
jgi:ABC-type lipoprotein release transport system permease subunit